jgi:carotenoid 1,2-hydratase
MSHDGQYGLSVIAFVGSVFSPYYAAARKCGRADPDNFCALNVALYSRRHKRWCMTERSARHNAREAGRFVIGPSQLSWDGSALTIRIKEVGMPVPHKISGQIRIEPLQLFNFSTPLDSQKKHRWGPIAPSAKIEVKLSEPAQNWSGMAYLDSNEGDEPIENAFHEWDWSRSLMQNGSTAVLYDMQYRNRSQEMLALLFSPKGEVTSFEPPARKVLPPTAWRVSRGIRSSSAVEIHEQLEDTPFYQRAILKSELLGEPVTSFHESLSIPRLVSPVVRAMLPWRMPRRF